jgi:hypothetical protein
MRNDFEFVEFSINKTKRYILSNLMIKMLKIKWYTYDSIFHCLILCVVSPARIVEEVKLKVKLSLCFLTEHHFHLVSRSKNECSYTSAPPIRLYGVVLS